MIRAKEGGQPFNGKQNFWLTFSQSIYLKQLCTCNALLQSLALSWFDPSPRQLTLFAFNQRVHNAPDVIHSTLIYALLGVQRAVAVGSTKRDLKIQSLIPFHHLSFHLLAARPQRCHVLISVDEARQPKVEKVDDIRSLVTCSDICRLYVTMNEACSMKCAKCL